MLLSILVVVAIKSDLANCIPLTVADKPNNGSSPQLTADELGSQTVATPPPLVFPTDESVYKIVENDTALKILQARAAAEVTPPEGQNVQQQPLPALGGADRADESIAATKSNGTQPSTTASYDEKDDGDDYSEEDDDEDDTDGDEDDGDDEGSVDSEVESVQPETLDKDEGLEEQFRNKENHLPLVIDNTMIEVSAMRQEHVWVIMVGIIIVLALAAYIAMVLYRNRLEKRYGMRQRLVTEDDYYTNNDI